MSGKRLGSGLLLVLAALTCGGPALADDARAAQLFKEGKALLRRGNIAEACAKFDASNALDSTLGSLLRAADCREKNGQLATAWKGFTEVAARAGADRADAYRREAERRAARLKPRLPRLQLSFAREPDGAVVIVDEVPLSGRSWQDAPLDPGPHRLTVAAEGYQPYAVEIVAVEGEPTKLLVPPLQRRAEPAQKPPPVAAPAPGSDETGLSGLQIGGLVVGSVGAAAFLTGAAFGGVAVAQWNDATERCPQQTCADPEAASLHQVPLRSANLSTGLLAGGGALLAAGVVLWFVGVDDDTAVEAARWSPLVAPGFVGAGVRGAF